MASAPALFRLPELNAGQVITGAWLTGVVAMILLSLRGLLKVRRLRSSADEPDDRLAGRYREQASRLGLRRAPRLRVTGELDSPALVGILRPDILIPEWLSREMDTDRLDWLLRHELMHRKLHDPVGLVLRRVSEICFFFHPLVWVAGRRWEEAMELACDRALVSSESEARSYAEGLYKVLEEHHVCRVRQVSAGLSATRTQIGKRIAALLSDPMRSPAHLSAASLVALALVAGAGLSTGLALDQPGNPTGEVAASSAVAGTQPSDASSSASQVKQRANATEKELRSLAVAIHAYTIDWENQPDRFTQLTTPIAYLTQMLNDPFAGQGSNSPATPAQYLQWSYTPDWKTMLLYSVGPDGRSQEGRVAFDPTNGAVSGGDIVRAIEWRVPYVRIEDPDLARRVKEQRAVMNRVQVAIEGWYLSHQALPQQLQQLTSPTALLTELPQDLFMPGSTLNYALSKDGDVARMWSVGPDSKNDDGLNTFAGVIAAGQVPDGDVITTIRLQNLNEKYKAVFSQTTGTAERNEMLEALLEMKKKDGKNNALIHYTQMADVNPPIPDSTQRELVERILGEGWSQEAESLRPHVIAWQRVFKEVRAGAALDYAKGIGYRGFNTPVPNFLVVQYAAKMLCVEGRMFEFDGKHGQAMEDYLTVLAMGRDFMRPEQTLISGLIGIAVESIALKQIQRAADDGKLAAEDLQHALERIRKIGSEWGTIVDMFVGELECSREAVAMARTDPERFVSELGPITSGTRTLDAEDVRHSIDRLEAEQRYAWSFITEALKKPCWDPSPARLQQDVKELEETLHPALRPMPNYFPGARVRYEVARSKLLQTQLILALELARIAKGRYPASLAELVPVYFAALPVDPLSGNMFVYSVEENGEGYTLHGAGPTGVPADTGVAYDPTNGTVSAGAVFY